MRALLVLVGCSLAAHAAQAQVKSEIVQFYSEAVRCDAKLFTPASHSATANAAGVVLAPGERATRASIESFAEAIAKRGIVALAIDYRGWGDCGGFLYFGEPVRWDDRLRFMEMTTTMSIRRQRLDPRAQVIDIRNAMTFLQGVPGVDRARIGVWGADLAGGHAIVVAGSDARVKAAVAQVPVIAGKDEPRSAFAPTAQQQAAMIKLARQGAPPTNERTAKAMNAEESRLALAEYRPYWYVDQIPSSTAVLFVVDDKTESTAAAASKLLKGATSVTRVAGANAAANAAAEWFVKHL